MKKQVIIIKGGEAHDSHKDYLDFLKKEKISREDLIEHSKKRWRYAMQARLGGGYEVFTPAMPSPSNAKYEEWKIWFEKMLPFLKKDAIYVGTSMGGIFLAKYFAEKGDFKAARALFLVAAPFKRVPNESIGTFILPKDLSKLRKLGSKVHLYHSKDDGTVPFSHLGMYRKELPEAQVRIFKDKGHFLLPEFPELVREIKKL